MGRVTQQKCKEVFLKDTCFRVFIEDKIISVHNIHNLTRDKINNCIRYMILEGIIEIGNYQINVYSHGTPFG